MHEQYVRHMNNDHKMALYDYLAHYNGITLDFSDSRTSVELVRIANDGLTISYKAPGQKAQTAVVTLSPPMASLGEARMRLVNMAKESAAALGHSHVRLKTYIPPSVADIVSLALSVAPYSVSVP